MKAQNNTYYIAYSINIEKKDNTSFKKEIQSQLSRAMEDFIKDSSIRNISVYSHSITAKQHGTFKIWNYLLLMQIKNKDEVQRLISGLKTISFPFKIETVRLELLETTPESTYPVPSETVQKRKTKPFYAIEYVDVREKHLEEFRDIMISNNGPAMKYIMQNKKWCYNMFALETVTVFYHNPKYPTWNQIHVIGLYLESFIRYKKDFSEGLKMAKHISFEDNFERLKQIRTMLCKTIGRKIV
jgi:hypothetical protein